MILLIDATTFCVQRWHVSGLSSSHPQGWRQARMAEPGTTRPCSKVTLPRSCVNTKVTQPIPVVKLVGSGTDNLLRARGNRYLHKVG